MNNPNTMTNEKTIQQIDREIETEVQAEIAQMEKNFACHGNTYPCFHPKKQIYKDNPPNTMTKELLSHLKEEITPQHHEQDRIQKL